MLSRPLYLASASPRRQEILNRFDVPFSVVQNFLEEEPPFRNDRTVRRQVKQLAKLKAESSAKNLDGLVLSADTVVVHKNKALGKPSSYEESVAMLTQLSGNTHTVISAICLLDTSTQKTHLRSEQTLVTFSHLSTQDIHNYIMAKHPFDKAGSYGIQDVPETFVKSIKGSFYNVMGLPIKSVLQLLRDYAIV